MFRVKQDLRTERRKIGDLGEDKACEFLMKHGHEVIQRNYLRKWGEIDIIARKGHKLHFVEVKTVSHLPVSHVTDGYKPEDNIHFWKLERLGRVIQTYLLGYGGVTHVTNGEVDWQLDVITVYLDKQTGESQLEHLEDVII